MPKAFIPGSKSSSRLRNVTIFKKVLREKAKQVADAAFIPGVLQNTSTVNPQKNAHNINSF